MNEGQLPDCERANVADAKLYRYLLNHEHPKGKSKAQFYELIGYTTNKAEQLWADLLRLAAQVRWSMCKPIGTPERHKAANMPFRGRSMHRTVKPTTY